MGFADYWNELKSYVPELPVNLAKRFINRARRDIYKERPWTFLFQESYLTTPDIVTDGTMAVVEGSQTITPDATAIAALTGLSNPFLTRRQLKFGTGNLIYNISAFDGVTITVDKPYFGDSNATSQYTVFQAYYSPPSTDFLRWVSVVDVANGFELDMLKTKEQLDRWDPQRSTTGQPVCIANHAAVPSGFWDNSVNVGDPLYEIWPHPTAARAYSCVYQRRGVDFVDADDPLPQTLPDELLLAKARMYAYEWQMARQPSFIGAYKTIVPVVAAEYRKLLELAAVQDDEIFVTQWQPRLGPRGLRWLNSNWSQSHDVSAGWGW